VEELPLPAPAPRTLSEAQYRSLKSTIARLPALYQRKGLQYIERQRKRQLGPAQAARTRPYRDQAIIEALISCGLRREELVNLDLAQIELSAHQAESLTPELLRRAKQVELRHVRGKGNSLRNLYLSVDARYALAAYLERERPEDAAHFAAGSALFLRAWNAPSPSDPGASRSGRLANNTINYIVAKVGRLHDAEQSDPARKLGRFHPHRLRHLFGFKLAASTGKDEPELRRRLGHRSTRYIQIYTNPPAEVAASYVEDF
jgi:integrase